MLTGYEGGERVERDWMALYGCLQALVRAAKMGTFGQRMGFGIHDEINQAVILNLR